ncbi:MAG: hypothetical protein Q4C70_02320 [Planctomycetia bacterium]|nr:hypothetical protein [Planctomycetia bacterium]
MSAQTQGTDQETTEKKENEEIESMLRKAEKLLTPPENATRKEVFDCFRRVNNIQSPEFTEVYTEFILALSRMSEEEEQETLARFFTLYETKMRALILRLLAYPDLSLAEEREILEMTTACACALILNRGVAEEAMKKEYETQLPKKRQKMATRMLEWELRFRRRLEQEPKKSLTLEEVENFAASAWKNRFLTATKLKTLMESMQVAFTESRLPDGECVWDFTETVADWELHGYFTEDERETCLENLRLYAVVRDLHSEMWKLDEDFDFDAPLTGKDEAQLGTLLEKIETQVTEMKEAEIEIFHDTVSQLIELKEGIQILLPTRYAEFREIGKSLTRRGWKIPPGFWDKNKNTK